MIISLLLFLAPVQQHRGFVLLGSKTLKFNVTRQEILIPSPQVPAKIKFKALRGRVVIDAVTLVTLDDQRVKVRFKDKVDVNSFSKEVKLPEGTPAFKEVLLELRVPGNARATRPKLECWIMPKSE